MTENEGDLISREALKEAVINNFDNLQAYFPKDFIEEIDNAPTVEPEKEIIPVCKINFDNEELKKLVDEAVAEMIERSQGEWKTNKSGYVYCSKCNTIKQQAFNKFCSFCGADMQRKENSNG